MVVCVLDGSEPPTQADREAVTLLRRAQKPVIYVANKVDTAARQAEASALYELGLPESCSMFGAARPRHRQARGGRRGEAARRSKTETPSDDGERRASRSSAVRTPANRRWLNRLTGEERSLVDVAPGTTRDPVDSRVTIAGKEFVVVDTAGIRRRARVERGSSS